MNSFFKTRIFIFLFFIPFTGFAQESILENNDSLNYTHTDSINYSPDSSEFNPVNLLNFSNYFSLLTGNVKESFTKPIHASAKDWSNFGKFAIIATGLSFADRPVQKEGLKFSQKNTTLNKVSHTISEIGGVQGTIIGLAATGTLGLIIKNKKLVNTTILASQAAISGSLITTSVKYLAGRRRPYSYLLTEDAKPTFMGPFSKPPRGDSFNNSFPSGHTTSSFAVATVYATEYRDKPLVPILAYSIATIIGVSRISENDHWCTDVFTGAAIGYLSGKQAVRNYNQYSKRKADGTLKNNISFNLQYSYGHWEPGMVLYLR